MATRKTKTDKQAEPKAPISAAQLMADDPDEASDDVDIEHIDDTEEYDDPHVDIPEGQPIAPPPPNLAQPVTLPAPHVAMYPSHLVMAPKQQIKEYRRRRGVHPSKMGRVSMGNWVGMVAGVRTRVLIGAPITDIPAGVVERMAADGIDFDHVEPPEGTGATRVINETASERRRRTSHQDEPTKRKDQSRPFRRLAPQAVNQFSR
jgi:hypothetical protein